MTPTHALAEQYQIPVIQPDPLKEQDDVLRYEPELILTCAYGHFTSTHSVVIHVLVVLMYIHHFTKVS